MRSTSRIRSIQGDFWLIFALNQKIKKMINDNFNILDDQIPFRKLIWYHLYMGIPVTLAYIFLSKTVVLNYEFPGLAAFLMVELFILAPIGLFHLFRKGKKLNGKYTLKNVISFREHLSLRQYFKWSVIGLIACIICYAPLYPVGLFLKDNLFFWLPEWYFDPGFGTSNTHLIAKAFLFAIIIDGLVGPIVEELFFRGYLLPRMDYLNKWAPILNGVLFGLYHYWQPHNLIAVSIIGVIISIIVWKNKNVYLGIIIHCTLNILGALSGYLAASGGYLIPR